MLSYIENGIRGLNDVTKGHIHQEFNIDEKALDCLSIAYHFAKGENREER
jgi:hypothetical protein